MNIRCFLLILPDFEWLLNCLLALRVHLNELITSQKA